MARTRRQIQASKVALLPEGFENLPADVAVLKEQMKAVTEVKTDVKAILASLGDIKLGLAERPTFEQAAKLRIPLESRIGILEENKAEVKGGWKLATIAGGIGAGVLSAGYYVVEGIKAILK